MHDINCYRRHDELAENELRQWMLVSFFICTDTICKFAIDSSYKTHFLRTMNRIQPTLQCDEITDNHLNEI